MLLFFLDVLLCATYYFHYLLLFFCIFFTAHKKVIMQNTWITCINNWPWQSFSQDYGLASHTTYVACVNLIHEWWDLEFNVDSEWQIYEKLFHGNFICSQSFSHKGRVCLEAVVKEIFFSYFVSLEMSWAVVYGLAFTVCRIASPFFWSLQVYLLIWPLQSFTT